MLRTLAEQARPKQWIKNLLVLAAPAAAGVLTDLDAWIDVAIIFAACCLASAGTYYWNDVFDVDADRLHPVKRNRPVASGRLTITAARVVGGALLIAGPLLALATRWQASVTLVIYVALTLSYSAVWKHIAVIDVVAVASCFVLRAIAGAEATDVPMSSWFVLVTTFGSLFIVAGKRYAELRELGDDSALSRVTLQEYSIGFLRTLLSVSCAATLVAYCIWAFEANDASDAAFPFYQLTIVPMLSALLRYLLILEQGHGSAPEEIFLADRTLQVLGALWLAVFAAGVYST